jgi:ATP/maltotriose-dependent transcriptional regulator MalT
VPISDGTARLLARALNVRDVRGQTIAEYFTDEVLRRQPAEPARFMLEISVLDELTADACAAATGRRDAAALPPGIEAASRIPHVSPRH